MKPIQISSKNWKRISNLRRKYKLKNNNEVIDSMFDALDNYCEEL